MSSNIIKNITSATLTQRGSRLELWWKSKGWSKAEFAKRMKIWPQNVNKYFSGILDPLNLIEQLIKEECDIAWIIDGKTAGQTNKGTVAETSADYGKKEDFCYHGISKQTKERIEKLIKLLESKPEKTHKDMLDLLIKTMEKRRRRKMKMR